MVQLVFNLNFLGIYRSVGCVFIQLTLIGNRTAGRKRSSDRRAADDLHDKFGVRRMDLLISLVPMNRDGW